MKTCILLFSAFTPVFFVWSRDQVSRLQSTKTLSKYNNMPIYFSLLHTLNLSGRLLKNYYSIQGANSS